MPLSCLYRPVFWNAAVMINPTPDSEREDSEQQLNMVLTMAEGAESEGQLESAEMLYMLALNAADEMYGEDSASTGQVVINFMHFCEGNDKPLTARLMQDRLRRILARYYPGIEMDRRIPGE